MSERSKLNRSIRAAKQEKQAKTVIKWIFGALIVLALAFLIYSMTM
jgi:hypothetical protein